MLIFLAFVGKMIRNNNQWGKRE